MMDECRMRGRRLRGALNKLRQDQKGQAFIMVLIMLVFGGLITVPLLTYMGNGLKTTQVYDRKKDELYAADAGIEDALWQIKYDNIKKLTTPVPYSEYDYTDAWTYNLPGNEQVNGKDVNVTIQNMWIPKNIDTPSSADANKIIRDQKLIVTGTTLVRDEISQYRIKVTYYPGAGENLTVGTLGIWLPRGYEYYTDSTHKSNLEDSLSAPYYKVPVTSSWAGNQAVLWSYPTPLALTSFPNVETGDFPMTMEVTFYFTPPQPLPNQPYPKPDAVAWITTSGVSGIPYSWDADIKVFKMTSVAAGDTTVESYVSKAEVRKMQSAMAGDYYATGNSLLSDSDGDYCRETWHDPSSAAVTASNIPTDAEVTGAYLYWSGWKNDNSPTDKLNDSCSSYANWNRSGTSPYSNTCWGGSSGYFDSHYNTGGSDSYRYLTLTSPLSLGSYSMGAVIISWAEWVSAPTPVTAFSDTCSASNLTTYWQNGGDWTYSSSSGGRYRGQHNPSGGADSRRYLALNSQNLSSYGSTGTIAVSWTLSESGTLYSGDGLDFDYSLDGGNTWTSNQVFRGNNPPGNPSYTITDVSLPSSFKIRFKVIGCTSSSQYCNISNITINVTPCYSTADGLDFAFSGDGGNNWSSNIQAFRGNIGTSQPSSNNFTYTVPSQYVTANFKIRFYLVGFGGSGQYCHIDNIRVMVPDTSVVFKIDDGSGAKQVYLDGNGNPQQGAQELTASKSQVLRNYQNGTSAHGISYSSYRDVTALVRTYSKAPTPPANNYPGYATYWVGGVYADTPRDGQSEDEWAYANWSLIIIYTSTDTQGHQLYLFDKFIYSNQGTVIFSDDCTSSNLSNNWQNGGDWSYYNYSYRARHTSSSDSYRYLTHSQNLSSYTTVNVDVSWDWWTSSSVGANGGLDLYLSSDGTNFDYKIAGFRGSKTSSEHQSYLIPADYLTSNFKMRFVVTGSSTDYPSGEYCYIDNISIAQRVNVDFDSDGQPGGTISGFIVPQRTKDNNGNWEVNAAKITCYVGEGDVWYTGDYLAINGTKLWDGTTTSDNSVSNPDNAFNSTSMGFSMYDGIDIDTLGIDPPNGRYITWDSGILHEGDPTAHIDMVTHQDVWNLVYIILSFRSSTTTGGAINYLIR